MKTFFAVLLLAVLSFSSASGRVIPTPENPPLLEGLISIHKNNAAAEKETLRQLEASYALTKDIKSRFQKLYDVRDVLKQRTNDLTGNVVLLLRIGYAGKKLIDLSKIFVEYTSEMPKLTAKDPTNLWYYSEALAACAAEVKSLNARLTHLSTAELNLLHATLDEKLFLVNNVLASIQTCESILTDAYFWASCCFSSNTLRMFIWDILNSKTTDTIAKEVIDLYTTQL